MSNGKYTNFEDLLNFFNKKKKECPKGVNLKLQNQKYLLLQFVFPDTGKRTPKNCNVQFTDEGIIQAVSKAWKVKEALNNIKTASDFWEWYEQEILEKNKIKNDLRTYREIFKEIEDEYFSGFHKNTGHKRSRDDISCQNSFRRTKMFYFQKFSDWDRYPSWPDLKEVLYSWTPGSKSFKDAYYVLKDIASRTTGGKIAEMFDTIEPKQKIYSERQSCSWDEFYRWYKICQEETLALPEKQKRDRHSWLWVAAMCVVFGLRPSEVAAIQNLTEPWSKDDVIIPALDDSENENLLVVIGNFTYFGTSTKTGRRIVRPMVIDKKIQGDLKLQYPALPEFKINPNNSFEAIANSFSHRFNRKLKQMGSPVTQAYAFRHLANQLGEKYGIPQEVRARILGHSVAVNDSVYKSRSNLKTEIDLLLNHTAQPLDYQTAINKLTSLGINTEDELAKLVLKTIYRL